VVVHFGIDETPDGRVLVSCLQVFDEDESPTMVANPHNDRVEQDALLEILERGCAPLFLFDELNRNLAWANCEFGVRAQDVRELIGCSRNLYAGAFNQNVSKALVNIEEVFRPAVQVEGVIRIPVVPVRLALSDFHFAELVGVSLEGDIHPHGSLILGAVFKN